MQSVLYLFSGPGATIPYLDSANTSLTRHCYVVVTVDSCLNASPSDTFCPIFLTGKALNEASFVQFSPFKGFSIGEYDLQTLVNNKWQNLSVKKNKGDTSYLQSPLACYVPRYYRVVGYQSGGNFITYSDSIMLLPFDTISPNAPTVYYASAISGLGYKLTWHWDKTTDVKYFEIWRSDSINKPKLIDTVIYDSTFIDKILPVNDKYKYYIIAIDSCDGNHRSPPSIIQQTMKLSINAKACKPSILLSWSAYKGFSQGVKTYNIFRSSPGNPQFLVATTGPTITSFLDTNVVEGIRYLYQIKATDGSGNYISWSDTFSGVPFVYTVPNSVQIKRATVLKTDINGAMLIEWNTLDLTDPYAVGYRLYVATIAGGPFTLLHDEGNKLVTSFVQQNVNTLTTSFYYYIAPYNICGKEGSPSNIHHSVNLQVTNTNLNAKLIWNKYSGFNVDHYEIYKAKGNASLVRTYNVTATITLFNDTNIYCHNNYTYQVYAIENGGNLVSVSDSITIAAFDNTPPARSVILSASVITTDDKLGQVLINFRTASDKNRKGYIINRSQNGGPYSAIDTFLYTGSGIYQYFDNSVNTVTYTYSYYLNSFDSCGNIAQPSDTHTVVHLVATPLNNYNQLTWSSYVGFPEIDYVILRRRGSAAWQKIAIVNGNINTYNDSNVYCHVLYNYQIMAVNSLTNKDSGYSNSDTARAYKTTPPYNAQIINATVTVTSNTLGQIQLNWKPSYSPDIEKYIIYRRNDNTGWLPIATTGGNVSTYTDVNLNTHTWSYYYKIITVDSCGNLSIDSSNYHRTINLTATPASLIVNLKWNTYWGFPAIRYDLYKNGKFFMSFDSLTTSFPDSFVMCPLQYSYIMKAIGNDTISWSNRDSAGPIDSIPPVPPVLKTVTVSIPNSTVDIIWKPTISGDALGYKIYRTEGSGPNQMIYQNNARDSIYTDTITLKGDPVCYEIVAYDHCNNTSQPSNKGCVINLNGSVSSLENSLYWNKYELWKDSVDYYNIYRKEDNGIWTLISTVSSPKITYVDKDLANYVKDFCYRVQAVEKLGGLNAQSWSTVVCLNQPPIVWVPNAFTPEYSYNLNDYFGPAGDYFSLYDMKIYDRWGELIYTTNAGKPWDGKFKGAPAVSGVYLYQIDIHGYNGNVYNFKGNISILR